MANLAKQQASPIATMREMLQKPGMKIELKAALPKDWSVDKFIRVCNTAVQRQPRIAECTAGSVAGAVMECAQLGLEPDPTLGHCALVPIKNNKKNVIECNMWPMYRGFIALAMRSGVVDSIYAEVVRRTDVFKIVYGSNKHLIHEPSFPQSQDPKDWLGVYAVVRKTNGMTDFVYLEAGDVAKSRNRSRAKDDGPWVTDTESMWQKTAIRKLAKTLELSPDDKRLQRAALLDELRERGLATKIGLGVDDYQVRQSSLETLEPPKRLSEATAPAIEDAQFEEVEEREPGDEPEAPKPVAAKPVPVAKAAPAKPITEKQRQALFSAAAEITSAAEVADFVKKIVTKHGFEKSASITVDKYDAIVKEIRGGGYPE